MNTFTVLQNIKEELSTIDTIKSLKIGFEKGADVSRNTPMCRIISESTTAKGVLNYFVFQVVIAFDLKNDIEKLYEEFYKLESEIKERMWNLPYKLEYIGTIMDEDKLSALKAGIIRFKIVDIGID